MDKLNKKEIKFITNPFKILNPDIRWIPGQDDLFQTAYEKQKEWDEYKDDIKTFGDAVEVFEAISKRRGQYQGNTEY